MKLLRVKSKNFKNCCETFEIDFVAKSKKTSEDKEYELQKITEELYTFNTIAVVGKNASGKTTAVELLDACFSILSDFRLESKSYNFDKVELLIDFFYDEYIYRYETVLKNSDAIGNKAIFTNQRIRRKKYYKTKAKEIFSEKGFEEVAISGELPEDTSNLFFVLKKKVTRAIYFDSFGKGIDTYRLLFATLKDYNISTEILSKVINIFDENISDLKKLDDHNYKMLFCNQEKIVSDKELLYQLSNGTTKGMLLYILVVASLQNGFDLIVDEIENHFHKTLVENMISLYKDKSVNKHQATLIFTTHYCELLDLFNRQDNIFIAKAEKNVYLTNMYSEYDVRPELLKSRQFYNNVFQTAVNYEELMALKKELKK